MKSRVSAKVTAITFSILFATCLSEAGPFRGGRNNNNNYYRPSATHTQTAPSEPQAARAEAPAGISYVDYDVMLEDNSETTIPWKLQSSSFKKFAGKEIVVTADFVKTKDLKTKIQKTFPATIDEQGNLQFNMKDLEEASVYRLDAIHLYGQDPALKTDDPELKPYLSVNVGQYAVTGGKTAEAKARRGTVLKALKEAFAWQHPHLLSWERRNQYGANQGNWCWKFYQFCANSHVRSDGNYIYYLHNQPTRIGGQMLKKLAGSLPVHGNLLKGTSYSGNHVGMVLDVDPATGKMITIEGNSANAVQILERTVDSFSHIGHIGDSTILTK